MLYQASIKTEQSFAKVKDSYIKTHIKGGVLVLTGKERLFKKAFISAVRPAVFEDISDAEMNYSLYYDRSDAVGSTPLDVADTPPFGSNMRLVVVHNYDRFTDKNDFLEYAQSPTKSTLLILDAEHKMQDDPLYRYFSKKTSPLIQFIDFPEPDEQDFKQLILAFVSKQGKKISPDAVNYLIENVNLDYEAIHSELEKILNYNLDKTYIDIDDIRDFTHSSKHANVFDFIDSIFERNRKKCFSIMPHLEKDASSALSLIMNNFVSLYYLKTCSANTTLNELSKITNISSYVFTRKKEHARNFTLKETTWIMSELFRLNTISVSAPYNIFKAHFDLFLFSITK